MTTPYTGVPGSASGERTNPTINVPADGDPGQASTFDPSVEALCDEVAALKQKVAYQDQAAFSVAGQPTAVIPTLILVGGGGGAPAFGSGWQQASSPQNFGFYKDLYGRLRLTGTISCTSGSPASTIFTLPAGYIPGTTRKAIVPAVNLTPGGSFNLPITIIVNATSGNVTFDLGPTQSLASLSQFYFDNVCVDL